VSLGALALALALTTHAEAPFLIAIDAGHGGAHEGAVGPAGSLEKDLSLQIAKLVAQLCQSQLGAKVALTREGDEDVELSERVAFANKKKASLFVSIHLNSMPTEGSRQRAHGVETYFLSADPSDASAEAQAERENLDSLQSPHSPGRRHDVETILNDLELTAAQADSSRLAEAIHERVVLASQATDRGIHQAPFFVLTGARMPGVLLELGFISNPEEEQKLRTPAYQRVLAQAVVDGIREYERVVAPRSANP
jgi:N-acetylmuramoyl-L-alanine amidase